MAILKRSTWHATRQRHVNEKPICDTGEAPAIPCASRSDRYGACVDVLIDPAGLADSPHRYTLRLRMSECDAVARRYAGAFCRSCRVS